MDKPIEPVAAGPDLAPEEGRYWVLLRKGLMVGSTWREPGSVVSQPCEQAIALCLQGFAIPAGPFGAVALMQEHLALIRARAMGEPVPAQPDVKLQPNIRITSNKGGLFQGTRTYVKADGAFHFSGDFVFLLATQSAEPGSEMAAYVQRLPRHRVLIEAVRELGPEERKRLARLRRCPDEASPADLVVPAWAAGLLPPSVA
jgi:hypothetical protein